MLLFNNGHAAVLLLALAKSLVFASAEDGASVELQAMAKTLINSLRVSWIDGVDSFIRPSESPCGTELAGLIGAIKAGEIWALQTLDASSKIQSGILRGNTRDIGMYKECVRASGRYNETAIRGKHCTIAIGTGSKEPSSAIGFDAGSLSSALCVPSSCNETQINQIINTVLQNKSVLGKFSLETNKTWCVREMSEDFTTEEILTIAFFSTVGAFMIFCTICDLVNRSRLAHASVTVNELAKFSLYTNAVALLSSKLSPQTMPAIQGMRFLSMCWVVLGHRYLSTLLRPMINTVEIGEWYDSWNAVYIQAAPFAVDTFFVISGFLMSYMFLKSKKSGKSSNFPMMYLHRYLRLTPCVAVLMWFVASLLHRIPNDLAREKVLSLMVNPCRKNWWINLFYIQNFVRKEQMCLSHTWYLAVDMQLFWISPMILYPLHRWPKYGLVLLSSLLVVSVITPAVILAVNGYSNALMRIENYTVQSMGGFYEFYIPTYNRGCAYFIGILLGYDVANKKRQLTQVNVAINWVVACILMLFCWWATHQIYNYNFAYDLLLEFVFAASLRPFWSIGIAWVVYACTQGYGGVVTGFLSLPLFQPLSRLSYCIYLVHLVIQVIKNVGAETPGIFSDSVILDDFWSDLVLSIAVAFIFSLFFESPVIVLEKMITNRGRKSELTILVHGPKKDAEMGISNKAMTLD